MIFTQILNMKYFFLKNNNGSIFEKMTFMKKDFVLKYDVRFDCKYRILSMNKKYLKFIFEKYAKFTNL